MTALFPDTSSGATLSPCRRYRYHLWRTWSPGPRFVVIGLNPSTADEATDDNTIRRCIGFAKREGCGGLDMLNVYAWRSRNPEALLDLADPVGPDNDDTIYRVSSNASRVVAAWGAWPIPRARIAAVSRQVDGELLCLGVTKDGHPRHPLYLRADAELVPWRRAA